MSIETMLKPIEILLIEDSPTDILITQEAFEQARLPNHLQVMEDGAAAMSFLYRQGQYTSAPRPDLILLDLNLPKKNGQEVLAELKADASLKRIPVIVLTTSGADEDIIKSYNLHANYYITKPVGFDNFLETINAI